ncbi:hypothetical protein NDU88_001980 [Pleurodeles waltl]|uniref:Uncharacterized protein n=1 Tax=Pleurodeles waltl TaxID=8319 RepID=A0AAV7M133_PLEWA|nr:hypothetical protein NDU88_001980 [Pleurodeles waltl]
MTSLKVWYEVSHFSIQSSKEKKRQPALLLLAAAKVSVLTTLMVSAPVPLPVPGLMLFLVPRLIQLTRSCRHRAPT